MSVSLLEVLEGAQYDLQKPEDAIWFLSKVSEFEELVTQAEDMLEELDNKRLDEED